MSRVQLIAICLFTFVLLLFVGCSDDTVVPYLTNKGYKDIKIINQQSIVCPGDGSICTEFTGYLDGKLKHGTVVFHSGAGHYIAE